MTGEYALSIGLVPKSSTLDELQGSKRTPLKKKMRLLEPTARKLNEDRPILSATKM